VVVTVLVVHVARVAMLVSVDVEHPDQQEHEQEAPERPHRRPIDRPLRRKRMGQEVQQGHPQHQPAHKAHHELHVAVPQPPQSGQRPADQGRAEHQNAINKQQPRRLHLVSIVDSP
jgi:hypothetical protein